MSKQLELSVQELEAIGFKGHYKPSKGTTPSKVYYTIPFLNGEFVYNVDNAPYKWYMHNKNGSGGNNNHLNITRLPELYTVLSAFKVKYNLVLI